MSMAVFRIPRFSRSISSRPSLSMPMPWTLDWGGLAAAQRACAEHTGGFVPNGSLIGAEGSSSVKRTLRVEAGSRVVLDLPAIHTKAPPSTTSTIKYNMKKELRSVGSHVEPSGHNDLVTFSMRVETPSDSVPNRRSELERASRARGSPLFFAKK